MSEWIRDPEEEEEEVQERPPFVVDDDQKAEWCLQKIKEKKAELERWKAHYEELFEKTRKNIEGDIGFFEAKLQSYFMGQMEAGFTKETKTQMNYALPSGKLVLKHQEPEYEKDEDAMVKWLEANNPSLVKIKKTPDWSGMKKTYDFSQGKMVSVNEDGEITEIPGVTAIPRDDIFKVEVK